MTFDLQPTLVGQLVTMRPLRADDYAEIYAVASDKLIWEQHPAHDRYLEPVFRKLFDESLASGGALVAIDNANDKIIGWSRYHGYDPVKSEVEIGWSFLARAYWGGRFNGEMKRLMLAHALRHVDRVIFVIGANNIRSRRAIERIGAAFAGSVAEDKVVYDIRRSTIGPGGAQPPGEIRTERLILRRWTPDDAPQLKAAIDSSLEHLQRWMPWARSEPTPIEGMRERLSAFSRNYDAGAEWLYGIFGADGQTVIGGTGLHPRIDLTGLEMGYWLRASETGKGYMTEAASALTRIALSLPHISHIEIHCDPGNAPSAAIPARLGYTHVATLLDQVIAPYPTPRDAMIWRMSREKETA